MADLRKIKKEKGSVLVPGANRLRRGVNFAVEVPQGVQASLVLYKKNARKPSVEIPFTEKDRTGDICAVTLPDLKTEDYQYNFLLDGKVIFFRQQHGMLSYLQKLPDHNEES